MPIAWASVGLGDVDLLPSHSIVPESGGIDAGDRLDERRLAGAVVADQGDHLAGVDLEVDARERPDGAEALGDAA